MTLFALYLASVLAGAPPETALVARTLDVSMLEDGKAVRKRVRVVGPRDWTLDDRAAAGSFILVGPKGEGTILIAAVLSPQGLGEHLTRLKNHHPSSTPSPPGPIAVSGINVERGERATRFVITGEEMGEMVMIERGGVIILYATIVDKNTWPLLAPTLQRCYPEVRVTELPELPREKAKR